MTYFNTAIRYIFSLRHKPALPGVNNAGLCTYMGVFVCYNAPLRLNNGDLCAKRKVAKGYILTDHT